MKAAIFSRTPLAGAPWELFKALRKYTHLETALVNKVVKYRDGRSFPHQLFLNSNKAMKVLENADILHIHNYFTKELRALKKHPPILAQFHSIPKLGNWNELMSRATKSYTIDQPQHKKFYNLPALPNVIDPDEYVPIRRDGKIRIAFAPSNRYPLRNPASKGYYEVKKILENVALKKDIEIIWIEGREYMQNLRMKQKSHILIDDVVNENFHRTSLEGACFGCAIVNRLKQFPFVNASLQNLEKKLIWLVENKGNLEKYQEMARLWVLQEFHAIDSVKKYQKAYKEILNGST